MTPQKQNMHPFTGPHSIEDNLARTIQHYTMLLQNLRLFASTNMTPSESSRVHAKIELVHAFLAYLHHLYDLLQEVLEASGPEVSG